MNQSEVHAERCYYYSSGSSLANERPGSLTADLKGLAAGQRSSIAPSSRHISVGSKRRTVPPSHSEVPISQVSPDWYATVTQAYAYMRRGL